MQHKESTVTTDLLKSAEVATRLHIGYTTFRTIVKHQPDFPKPILLTPKSRPLWRNEDIEQYLRSKSS